MMKNAKEKNVKSKQKNKNNVKKKKVDIKSSIDSPFSLDWPSIDYGNYSELVSCLKQSFGDYLAEIKKADTESTLVKNDKNHAKRLLCTANRAIIFGYNAVMRGLEKERIKTVLVNADAAPNITKSFIPICNLRSIPLIPVKNLSDIFVNKVTIKSTLAVGFTLSACEKDGPFYNLHLSCCKALDYDNCREDLEMKEIFKLKDKNNQLESHKQVKANLISSYHLKREDSSTRVFQPPKRENMFDISFIRLDKSEHPKPSSSNYGPKLNNKRKATIAFKDESTVDTKTTLPEVPELSFFIDVNDDIELEEEEKQEQNVVRKKSVKNKHSTARYFEALTNSPSKSDSQRKPHYLPAKIKKIKANEKRRL